MANVNISWKRFNYKKLAIICGCVFVFGLIYSYLLFPTILKVVIAKTIALKPGAELRDMYVKTPFAIDFKIYVFNILNREEVANGGKPKLQEIGPYWFDEWKEKLDLEDDAKEDTLTYKMQNTYIFRPDLSNGLTGNEIITTVNPLLMGMALAVNVDKKPMLSMISNAINKIFHDPIDPFWTGRVMDLLFDGINVDCSSENFDAKATCSVLGSGEVQAIRVINNELFKFSMLRGVNATPLGTWKVSRGVKNIRNVGKMLSYNDEDEMDFWGTDECNQYRGTDSTIFPPRLRKNDGLWAHEPSLCLSIGANYVGRSSYAGLPTWEYEMTLGDTNVDESLQCYCMDPPENCPRAGTRDMFNCMGTPIVISLPHFYYADPEILQHIASGLNPNKKDHGVFVHFESTTGSPLSGAKRLQLNMDMVPVPEVECMKNLSEMLLPMIWLEESIHLNKTWTNLLKYQLFLVLKIVAIIKWICIIVGALGCPLAAFLEYLKQNDVTAVTPIEKTTPSASSLNSEPVSSSISSGVETDTPEWQRRRTANIEDRSNTHAQTQNIVTG